MSAELQESLEQALDRPGVPRVWIHVGCAGWVLFRVAGGWCLSCEAGPLKPGQYAKPGETAASAA